MWVTGSCWRCVQPWMEEKGASWAFLPRLSKLGRPCRLSPNRHQRGRGHAVPLQTQNTIADEPQKTITLTCTFTHTHTLTCKCILWVYWRVHTNTHTGKYILCVQMKRFAEAGIYTMLCSMIKNNCSTAVCAQWCKVTWYCPTALFCMSWTGPCRQSPNTCQVTHTQSQKLMREWALVCIHTHTHNASRQQDKKDKRLRLNFFEEPIFVFVKFKANFCFLEVWSLPQINLQRLVRFCFNVANLEMLGEKKDSSTFENIVHYCLLSNISALPFT